MIVTLVTLAGEVDVLPKLIERKLHQLLQTEQDVKSVNIVLEVHVKINPMGKLLVNVKSAKFANQVIVLINQMGIFLEDVIYVKPAKVGYVL